MYHVYCGKQREATASIQPLVTLQPWLLSLQWKTWLWPELQPRVLRLQWRTCPWGRTFWCWWCIFTLLISPTLPSLHLRHSSFSNPSVALPTSQLILPFRRFTYVTAHSPTLPSLYPRHSSLSNPSVASPTSQLIFQPFFAFPTSQALHLRHLASCSMSGSYMGQQMSIARK